LPTSPGAGPQHRRIAEAIRWLATTRLPPSTGPSIDLNGASYVAKALIIALAMQAITIPLQKTPRQVEKAIAPMGEWGPRWVEACGGSSDWEKAGAAGAHPRQYLSRRHLRHFSDPDHRQ
jgi:hypothetical protein